jgi:hypothetical protein
MPQAYAHVVVARQSTTIELFDTLNKAVAIHDYTYDKRMQDDDEGEVAASLVLHVTDVYHFKFKARASEMEASMRGALMVFCETNGGDGFEIKPL